MADEFKITISGMDEIVRFFDEEPKEMRTKVLGKALQAAAEPIKTAVRAETPESEIPRAGEPVLQEGGTYTVQLYDHLKDAVVAVVGVTDQGGNASIGFGSMGFIARFLEYGHRIIGHAPRHVDKGGFVAGKPFMRPALANSSEAAVDAFAEVIEGFYTE